MLMAALQDLQGLLPYSESGLVLRANLSRLMLLEGAQVKRSAVCCCFRICPRDPKPETGNEYWSLSENLKLLWLWPPGFINQAIELPLKTVKVRSGWTGSRAWATCASLSVVHAFSVSFLGFVRAMNQPCHGYSLTKRCLCFIGGNICLPTSLMGNVNKTA